MATQRIINKEKTAPEADRNDTPARSELAPAVPAAVIYKLLSFTFAMITLPIGTYFFIVNYVFVGNTTWGGALAAVMANVVLIGYVIVAMQEDASDRLEEEAEERRKKAL